jgi:hypothetical protein
MAKTTPMAMSMVIVAIVVVTAVSNTTKAWVSRKGKEPYGQIGRLDKLETGMLQKPLAPQ